MVRPLARRRRLDWIHDTLRGRERAVLVDSLDLLIGVLVAPAYVSDIAGGHTFIPVRYRWTIERSLAWFGTHRQLDRHALEHTTLEHTIAAAETWVRIASTVIVLDQLYAEPGNPQSLTWTTWTT